MNYDIYASEKKVYAVRRSFFQRLFGYCPCCNRYFRKLVTTERRHTEYCEQRNNYLTACRDCHLDDDAYYDELWKEYNAGRL